MFTNRFAFFLLGLKLIRPSVDVARYTMNQNNHFRSDGWSQANHHLIYNRRTRAVVDGLTTIDKLHFTIETRERLLYTLVSIDLSQSKGRRT